MPETPTGAAPGGTEDPPSGAADHQQALNRPQDQSTSASLPAGYTSDPRAGGMAFSLRRGVAVLVPRIFEAFGETASSSLPVQKTPKGPTRSWWFQEANAAAPESPEPDPHRNGILHLRRQPVDAHPGSLAVRSSKPAGRLQQDRIVAGLGQGVPTPTARAPPRGGVAGQRTA